MALDHYIPQVYLRQFNTINGVDGFTGIKKSNGEIFPTKSKDVCRIESFNTNEYFDEPRLIEDFLKTIEPKVNDSINKINNQNIDYECIYAISGLIAYINSCSPGAIRLSNKLTQKTTEHYLRIGDQLGKFPSFHTDTEDLNIGDLIDEKELTVSVDNKYCHAIGVSNILQTLFTFGNFKWEILQNNSTMPYITSDYPIAIEQTFDPTIVNKIFPLTPKIAIKIYPERIYNADDKKVKFDYFGVSYKKVDFKIVDSINREIIKSAESLIFAMKIDKSILNYVKQFGCYHVDYDVSIVKYGTKSAIQSHQVICKKNHLTTDST